MRLAPRVRRAAAPSPPPSREHRVGALWSGEWRAWAGGDAVADGGFATGTAPMATPDEDGVADLVDASPSTESLMSGVIEVRTAAQWALVGRGWGPSLCACRTCWAHRSVRPHAVAYPQSLQQELEFCRTTALNKKDVVCWGRPRVRYGCWPCCHPGNVHLAGDRVRAIEGHVVRASRFSNGAAWRRSGGASACERLGQ